MLWAFCRSSPDSGAGVMSTSIRLIDISTLRPKPPYSKPALLFAGSVFDFVTFLASIKFNSGSLPSTTSWIEDFTGSAALNRGTSVDGAAVDGVVVSVAAGAAAGGRSNGSGVAQGLDVAGCGSAGAKAA